MFFVFAAADLDKARTFISALDAAETARNAGVLAGDYWFVERSAGCGAPVLEPTKVCRLHYHDRAAGRLACLHSIFSGPEVNRLRLPQLPRRDLSTFSLIPRDWPRHDATAVRDANWNLSARVLACAGPQRIALTRVNTASQSTRTA